MAELAAIGIDLGTTYSAVAMVNDQGYPEIIPNSENERLTPSAVFFDEDTIIVGQDAKNATVHQPDQVIQFAKRELANTDWTFLYQHERLSPVDVSAIILRKLKQDAERRLNRKLPHAVITVPAYFDDQRRRLTTAAARIAALDVLDLVNEPTAAAIAFGFNQPRQKATVLIYDLGGGTFDVTVMRIEDQRFDILATDGYHKLGGKDFDDAIMNYLGQQFQQQHGFDPTRELLDAALIRSDAERAKRELSKRRKTTVIVRAAGSASQIELSQDRLKELVRPKIDTTLAVIRNTLQDASLTPDRIDRVLLVGGSTRLISVREALKQMFQQEPVNCHAICPDSCNGICPLWIPNAPFALSSFGDTERVYAGQEGAYSGFKYWHA